MIQTSSTAPVTVACNCELLVQPILGPSAQGRKKAKPPKPKKKAKETPAYRSADPGPPDLEFRPASAAVG